jgi:predicted O-methyltransferase YrrM
MTIASGDGERWAAVDHYLVDRLITPDPAQDAIEASEAAGLPRHEVSPTQGKLLHLLARMVRARAILELGTLAGYSTIWLARALPPGGRLVTLEADPDYAAVAQASITGAGLEELVDLRVGPAIETLPHLDGPFDLIFIDADKRSNPDYLEWALKLSREGTVIVADNVIRGGVVLDPASTHPAAGTADPAGTGHPAGTTHPARGTADLSTEGVRRFLDMVAAHPRLDATAIQTVGVKGWDGFALALVSDGGP